MNKVEEARWNTPFAPGPIDSMRRRAAPMPIKRLQCTLPVKRKLTGNSQLYVFHPTKEPIQILINRAGNA